MNSLSPFFARCADTLWTVSWQIAALVALVWVISLCCRRASASFRYYLWCVVLLRLLLPVSLTLPFGLLSSPVLNHARVVPLLEGAVLRGPEAALATRLGDLSSSPR